MPSASTSTAAKKKNPTLPAALAKRATAAASAKTKRLHAEARSLLSLIARRKKEITEAFYDIGEALTRLKNPTLIAALDRRSFAEVCEKDAAISVATGERLVAIVASLTRVQALSMGQKKAMAMVTLAAATPEKDTAAGLFRKKAVAVPGGRAVAPRTASANELEQAATAIRRARASRSAGATKADGSATRPRGRTTSEDERSLAALLQRRLRQLGMERAVVTAVATKPGQGSDLRFEHIPAAKVDTLSKALGR